MSKFDISESEIDENDPEVQGLLKIWSEIENNKETLEVRGEIFEDFETFQEELKNSNIFKILKDKWHSSIFQ